MTTHNKAGALLRFLLSTGLRLGEAYKGIRKGQYWVVTGDHSKNGREHRVWLSDVALAQLEAHPWAASREAVQLWLKENVGGWTAHDLRRTFSTRNNGMGVPPYVVEKMLNHTFDGAMAATITQPMTQSGARRLSLGQHTCKASPGRRRMSSR